MYQLLFPKTYQLKSKSFKTLVFIMLLSFLVISTQGQTNIKGNAVDYPNQQLVAYRYLDMFSNVTEKIGSTKISEQGYFEMNLPIVKDQLVLLTVNRINGEVLIHANVENTITFNKPTKETPRTYANTNTLVESNHLVNKEIHSFDDEYEQFLQESSFTLKLKMASGKSFQKANEESLKGFQVKNIAKSDSSIPTEILSYAHQLKTFKGEAYLKYNEIMDIDPFFKEYVTFRFASLEVVNNPREEVYNTYFSKKLNFNNPAVVSFFQSFYSRIWEQESNSKSLLSVLNNERNFYSLDTTAAKIPVFENEEIRHLALVNGLYHAYNTKLANQELLLTLLVREAKSNSSMASTVAKNYVNKIIRYKKGVKLSDFRMLDKQGNFVISDDLHGKFVYINFFTSWCTSCEGEMYIINNLKEKYGKEIKFVSINMDDNYKDFKTFLSKHRQFDWKFLYGPSEEEVMAIFNVQTIPTYVFIDAEGNWINSNTKSPSEGISNDFDLIMRKAYQTPTRYKVWDE